MLALARRRDDVKPSLLSLELLGTNERRKVYKFADLKKARRLWIKKNNKKLNVLPHVDEPAQRPRNPLL